MKFITVFLFVILFFFIAMPQLPAQNQEFDVSLYKDFLQQHKDMPADELMELYPAGLFHKTTGAAEPEILFLDQIDNQYRLTAAEKELLTRHGFVVTERLQGESFGERLLNIYQKDLPVFVSADAILHAFHRSYDQILKEIEVECLIPEITTLLNNLHDQLPVLADRYAGNEDMQAMLEDVDLYLTIPRIIFDDAAQPYFTSNIPMVESIMQDIADLQPADVALFSATPKIIDFSQFKVRGHYLDESNPVLADYFQAMIWLGRIEIYLLPPRAVGLQQTPVDIQRQVIDALLITELVDLAGAYSDYQQIESMLSFFIGGQDNVTLDNLNELKQTLEITEAGALLDTSKLAEFQGSLALEPYARQRILSQILLNDPCSPDSIVPASAFMLYGQRFVIDSYVTGNVVYDRIRYHNAAVLRMLPSTLDIMFALGNDAAGQLLQAELATYHYAGNLSALRYLIDAYTPEFWNSTLYNMWLHTIRALNPPEQRQNLPPFAQTAAWWQKNMNSQLSSWTELRHDHLLYAKQSYTGGSTCSFPHSYVDPVPEVFARLKYLGLTTAEKIGQFSFNSDFERTILIQYFNYLAAVCDTLQNIARQEIEGQVCSAEEQVFLQRMISPPQGGCMPEPSTPGWYQNLFYSSYGSDPQAYLNPNFLTADYHTAPTDESGNFVGWIAQAGTGRIDLLILCAELPGTGPAAFIGPVYSYHEYTSNNFFRLSDQEWESTYLELSTRPDWTNLYLCNNEGNLKPSGSSLLTDIPDDPNDQPLVPVSHLIAHCYPNPFNAGTLISFNLPERLNNTAVQVGIYDLQGRKLVQILDSKVPAGNYVVRWNGTDSRGNAVASGVYFYEIKAVDEHTVGKMQLIR